MLKMSGIVLGVKKVTRTNKQDGSTWEEHFIGFSSPVEGGYQNETMTSEAKLTKQAIDSGAERLWNELKGNYADVEIFQSNNVSNGRAYLNNFVVGKALPINVKKSS